MFRKSATFYDALYNTKGKDYAHEVQRLKHLIQQHKCCSGNALLDVACGTGGHIHFLRKPYSVEGLDIDPGMLENARKQYPDIAFHQADMVDFDLNRQFDIITCLFSSIGFVKTVDRLMRTVDNFAKHLYPGGVLIVEPWLTPEVYRPGTIHADFVDEPELKIARMNISELEGRASVVKMHYQVGTPQGIEHYCKRLEMGLFTHEEYLEAFHASGLKVVYDSKGLIGRGLYIGVRLPK